MKGPWSNQPVAPGSVQVGAGSATTVLALSFAQSVCPADTSEDALANIAVPANLLGANGALRITCSFSHTSNANAKTLRVRFSGAAGTAYASISAANGTDSRVTIIIGNRGATNSQHGHALGYSSGVGIFNGGISTSAVDTTAATSIVISAQKANAGDTITLESYIVELIKP